VEQEEECGEEERRPFFGRLFSKTILALSDAAKRSTCARTPSKPLQWKSRLSLELDLDVDLKSHRGRVPMAWPKLAEPSRLRLDEKSDSLFSPGDRGG
jgi:hypothetical protein